MRWSVIDSPIGDLSLAVDDIGLCRLRMGVAEVEPGIVHDKVLLRAHEELKAYFAGELTEFSLPLSVPGGSEFERAVWNQLRRIPYGEMQTYGEVAKVVGAGGKMVGFGGGIPRKRHLLELEARVSFETLWG